MHWRRARTSAAVVFSQDGGERLYGSALLLSPLPGVCMRPMVAVCASPGGAPRTWRTRSGAALRKGCAGGAGQPPGAGRQKRLAGAPLPHTLARNDAALGWALT